MKNYKKGFTLIELLVVISIIALLSSIVLASLQYSRKMAQATAFKEEIRQFVLALELYKNDNGGNLPTGFIYMQDDWESGVDEVDGRDGTDYNDGTLTAHQLITPYMKKFPKPPFLGGFGYIGGDLISQTDQCGTSNYFLQVEGSENTNYFSDWLDMNSQAYDTYFGAQKCYPLK